jgi:D-sedoheptulose 7-phosphate isomerase
MEAEIRKSISASIETKQKVLADDHLITQLAKAAQMTIDLYKRDGSFLAIGNGGSASDVQHIVAELVGRFYYDRPPLRAQALSTNTSNLTCIGNDYGYDQLFSRQVQAMGRKGDVLLALSTSGNSKNVILAIQKAREIGMHVIGMTGATGGHMSELCDIIMKVPSKDTARIQECHIMLGHIYCEMIEAKLFPKSEMTNK